MRKLMWIFILALTLGVLVASWGLVWSACEDGTWGIISNENYCIEFPESISVPIRSNLYLVEERFGNGGKILFYAEKGVRYFDAETNEMTYPYVEIWQGKHLTTIAWIDYNLESVVYASEATAGGASVMKFYRVEHIPRKFYKGV